MALVQDLGPRLPKGTWTRFAFLWLAPPFGFVAMAALVALGGAAFNTIIAWYVGYFFLFMLVIFVVVWVFTAPHLLAWGRGWPVATRSLVGFASNAAGCLLITSFFVVLNGTWEDLRGWAWVAGTALGAGVMGAAMGAIAKTQGSPFEIPLVPPSRQGAPP